MTDTIIWLVTAAALGIGLAGTVVPVLPGTLLILLGAFWHHFFFPTMTSWWTLGGLTMAWIISVAINWGSGLVGARVFGASKWGLIGAGVGALVGLFLPFPGLLMGPIIGALLAEKLIAKKEIRAAAKSGAGVGLGLLVSMFAQVVIALGMIGVFLGDCFLW
jgi:uncharacterized protein YqgC (DUF456 family)